MPAAIHLPLSPHGLENMLLTAKRLLTNNFYSCFATIAGSIILFHYEGIIEQQDECPLILCYSSGNGTGKFLAPFIIVYTYQMCIVR